MAIKPDQEQLNEVASTRDGRDITRGYIDSLPYIQSTDPILNRAGGLDGYRELLRDDQVSACFAQRRHAVISRPWDVTPGGPSRKDKLAAELVKNTLKNLDWDTITDHMLYSRFYGYGVAEIIWEIKEDMVCIKDIKVRDCRRFVFAPDFSLRLLTSSNPNGEVLPERKFWCRSVGASHADEPYGLGLGNPLYWPVWFKHNGARFWAVHLEKFGSPTSKGEFPRGATEAEKAKLLATLRAIAHDSGVMVPEGFKIDFLEATRGGNASYESWMKYWDGAIAKIILGQTMTTQDGSSYAQATVHYDVRQDVVKADSDLVCQGANGSWVKWLVDYNYPGAAYPTIWRNLEDAEDTAKRSTTDKALFDMGFKLTPEAVAEVYGDHYEPIQPVQAQPETETPGTEKEAPKQPTPEPAKELQIGFRAPVLAEPEPDDYLSPIQPMADRLDIELADAWDETLEHIQSIVDTAPDLPTLRDSLLNSYGDLPIHKMGQIMGKALEAAELSGRYDVEQESDRG